MTAATNSCDERASICCGRVAIGILATECLVGGITSSYISQGDRNVDIMLLTAGILGFIGILGYTCCQMTCNRDNDCCIRKVLQYLFARTSQQSPIIDLDSDVSDSDVSNKEQIKNEDKLVVNSVDLESSSEENTDNLDDIYYPNKGKGIAKATNKRSIKIDLDRDAFFNVRSRVVFSYEEPESQRELQYYQDQIQPYVEKYKNTIEENYFRNTLNISDTSKLKHAEYELKLFLEEFLNYFKEEKISLRQACALLGDRAETKNNAQPLFYLYKFLSEAAISYEQNNPIVTRLSQATESFDECVINFDED